MLSVSITVNHGILSTHLSPNLLYASTDTRFVCLCLDPLDVCAPPVPRGAGWPVARARCTSPGREGRRVVKFMVITLA